MKYAAKRCFDICASAFGLIVFGWLIVLCWIAASIETRSNGFFRQTRIGRYGKPFRILKIKTMHNRGAANRSSVTTAGMSSITRTGAFFRRYKLDELPQLVSVLLGDMSFVGPRPDVPGFADKLQGEDRIILNLRPGITGPASLKFYNEEEILAQVPNPEAHNANVIWPAKVALNKDYAQNFSLMGDLRYIFRTIVK